MESNLINAFIIRNLLPLLGIDNQRQVMEENENKVNHSLDN